MCTCCCCTCCSTQMPTTDDLWKGFCSSNMLATPWPMRAIHVLLTQNPSGAGTSPPAVRTTWTSQNPSGFLIRSMVEATGDFSDFHGIIYGRGVSSRPTDLLTPGEVRRFGRAAWHGRMSSLKRRPLCAMPRRETARDARSSA